MNKLFNDFKTENESLINDNKVIKAENEELNELLENHKEVIAQQNGTI